MASVSPASGKSRRTPGSSAAAGSRAPKPAVGSRTPKPAGLTPAMRQYIEQKSQVGDAVLLFRMGDFYETFYDDAKTMSRVLGLTLTARGKDGNEPIPLAGIPYHAAEGYIAKLVRAGFKVAVSEQMEDARQAKGVIKREVVRIITPGTLTDDALLDEKSNNYLLALCPADHRGAAVGGSPRTPVASATPGMPGGPKPTRPGDSRIGLAGVELASGRFFAQVLDACDVVDELARLGPAELLTPRRDIDEADPIVAAIEDTLGVPVTVRPEHAFDPVLAERNLCSHFGVSSVEGFGFDTFDASLCAAAALLDYLKETQKAALGHILKIEPRVTTDCVAIDQVTLRALEVERTIRDGDREGSLLSSVDMTVNPMGARLLRSWLCFPPRDPDEIERRQWAVASLRNEPDRTGRLRAMLADMVDVERITARIGVGRACPRDLAVLGRTLGCLGELGEIVGPPATGPGRSANADAHADADPDAEVDTAADASPDPVTDASAAADANADTDVDAGADTGAGVGAAAKMDDLLSSTIRGTVGLDPLADLLSRALKEDAPLVVRDGGFIADGYDAELDRLRSLESDGTQWLAKFQASEIERTGIPKLKVGYNSVFGYYIEITHAHRDKAPAEYVRKQTIRNAERYITDELKRFEQDMLSATDRAKALEIRLFDELRERASEDLAALRRAAESIATLDVLAGLAELARRRDYCRPELVRRGDVGGAVLEIEDGRHPVLDASMPDRFVPNDCRLTPGGDRCLIITGPNMAGKSTYIRQVALLTLLAQTGSCVPARSMRWSPVDRIFARVGASDELARGHSTFMVEMVETARILNNATADSLVVLDEIGRGTSTYDGLAIAWAVTEHIVDRLGCRALFATHYHELTELAEQLDGAANFNVLVREELRPDGAGRDVVFLHKIVPGATDRSYGVHVAAMAGLPASVVRRSEAVLNSLEERFSRQSRDGALADDHAADSSQLTLFDEAEALPAWWRELVDALDSADIDRTTPIDALAMLQELKRMIHDRE